MSKEMTVTEVVDGEVIASHKEARASVERAKGHALGFWQEVKWQIENHAWEALGYDSLDAMWDAEYAAMNVGIARSDRPELVAALRSEGQTQAQIAGKLGVSLRTIESETAILRDEVARPSDLRPPNF